MATIQSKGIFLSLVAQLDKLARHNRQGSFRTKARYYEACKRFCAYLAAEYHLQKLENISGKHLVSYVLYLQDTGKSASTVKTDLAAIVKVVRENTKTPCAIGFGISTPEQAAKMAGIADGAIVGSAIIKLLEQYGTAAPEQIGAYVKRMKDAVRG